MNKKIPKKFNLNTRVEEKPSPLQDHVRTDYPDKALRTRAEYSRVAFADSTHCSVKEI